VPPHLLGGDEDLIGLMAVNRELIAQAEASDDSERVVLDMDSTESPVFAVVYTAVQKILIGAKPFQGEAAVVGPLELLGGKH